MYEDYEGVGGWVGKSKKKSYSSSSWDDYSGYFSKWEDYYKIAENRRKYKKDINDYALESYTPIDVRVWVSITPSIFKRNRMTIDIPESRLKEFSSKEKVKKIVDLYDKIPYNSDLIDSFIVEQIVTWKRANNLPSFVNPDKVKSASDIVNIDNAIRWYDSGVTTYAELRTWFRPLTSTEKCEQFADSDNMWKWWGVVWHRKNFSDRDTYNRNIRIIQSKIKLVDTIEVEESFRKGKRINRNFLNWSSIKPLMSKTVNAKKKKKIMFIIDCSGSMNSGASPDDPSHKAISFAAAAVNSWIFNVEQVIYHSSGWWQNCIREIRKGELFNLYGWSEWFERIDDNLNSDWVKSCDYAVCLTDLCIGSYAEQWLYDYLHKAKKHMVLSFLNSWTIKGMTVRTVDSPQTMINALVSLTQN